MRVAFRVDASLVIGTGHVMRCLTLAQALRQRGAEVSFLCRAQSGDLRARIIAEGFEVASLTAPLSAYGDDADMPAHAPWLGTSWRADARETVSLLGAHGAVDWLIVDHYALDHRWENEVRRAARALMVIDDLADRRHDCDLLLDQNLTVDAGRYDPLLPAGCARLLGPRYALLREEFESARGSPRARDGSVRRVLIFQGGVDADDCTGRAIEAVACLGHADLAVDVVVGATNPRADEIERRCAELPRCAFHRQATNMAELMARADLAIGAGGGAMLERAALGLPAIVFALADNQIPGCQAMASLGGILYLGRPGDGDVADTESALRVCLRSPELMRGMTARLAALVDARGAPRVADALRADPLALRAATQEDCERVWQWRNHPDIRRHALNPAEIDLATHRAWFATALVDPDKAMLIGEDGSGPVGVLRYDIREGGATISVYLVPGRQGRGLGPRLIEAGTDWLRVHRPKVAVIHAEIRPENVASLGAFAKAGFVPVKCLYVQNLRGG